MKLLELLSKIVLKRFMSTNISLQVGISILSGVFTLLILSCDGLLISLFKLPGKGNAPINTDDIVLQQIKMLAFIILIVNGAEFQHNYSKFPSVILIGIIWLIVFTWFIAFFGAFMSSILLIQFSIAVWTVLIVAWLSLTVLTLKHSDKKFCVAIESRCAPTMWLFENESGDSKSSEIHPHKNGGEKGKNYHGEDGDDYEINSSRDDDEDESDDENRSDDNLDDENNDADTEKKVIISRVRPSAEKTKKHITTDPPNTITISRNLHSSNLTTRVMQFKMITKTTATIYDNIYLNIMKTVPRKKDKREVDGGYDIKPAEELKELKDKIKGNPWKYIITITYFLPLFLYSWFILFSYCVELLCMKSCDCASENNTVLCAVLQSQNITKLYID